MDELRSAMMRRFQRGGRPAAVSLALLLAAVVVLFASANAWPSRPAPLAGTHASPEALAEAVLAAVREGRADDLRAMALTEQEFRDHVWPELPASRPERNMPFSFVWNLLRQNSDAHLRQTVGVYQGVALMLVGVVEFHGETTAYAGVTVRRDTRLVVRTSSGDRRVVRLFGSTIEQDGAFKVFSYVVD